jgi:hypothetical protein
MLFRNKHVFFCRRNVKSLSPRKKADFFLRSNLSNLFKNTFSYTSEKADVIALIIIIISLYCIYVTSSCRWSTRRAHLQRCQKQNGKEIHTHNKVSLQLIKPAPLRALIFFRISTRFRLKVAVLDSTCPF